MLIARSLESARAARLTHHPMSPAQALPGRSTRRASRWRAKLRRDARLGVGSLAQILGYSEVSAFTWFFTGMAGQPPSAWRQAELAKANV